jgi:MoaA/NifB/PqqE/SkfB family radical SAM enzyme
LATKAAVKGENARLAVDTGQLVFDYPSMMILAFDESCNLSCPSCRCQVISEKGELQTIKEGLITESIMPILKRTKTLHLNAAGELMVSRPLRRLLSKLNRQDFPELRIDIITNGTLFTSKEWEKFPNIHDMVEYVRVSTDAASKDTFEKLRRGGKWEPFMENMRFLAGLRKSGVINHLGFSMTYQIDNFREMADFVDMCHALDPESYVIFEKLEKMALTAEEYAAMAVHHPLHPLHEAFLEITRQPKFKSDLIAADFMGLHAV